MTKNHPRTIVYIDGFNLYYGCLKGTPYRWIDLCALADLLLPKSSVVAVKYFTARVSGSTTDPNKPRRQETYFRALAQNPRLQRIEGTFLSNIKRMPVHQPGPGQDRSVMVRATEEKGSDVNLAVHLVHDGHLGHYETAVVISNDSDLAEAIRLVREDLKLPVGVISPFKTLTHRLRAQASFTRPIRTGHLQASQLPAVIRDADGRTIHKPKGW